MWQQGHLTVKHKMEALVALISPKASCWRGDGNGLDRGRGVEPIQRFNGFKNRAD